MSHDDTRPEYWWCLNHHEVEGRDGCRAEDRLGPYPTYEDAKHAIEHLQMRNQELDEQAEAELTDEEREKRADREKWGGPFGF